ncbi:MAG: TfoX/Sxy family protein [Candidatus Methylacidiphilales bacterium]|nr:TfoX/Sxy family protein [Candidatus Methylacidiphilales bacterium]
MTAKPAASSASRQFAEHIADLLRPLGDVSVARFFGGQQLRVGSEQLAMVHDGELYFRVGAESLREELRQAGGEAFSYTSSKRTVTAQRYFGAPADWIEDPERLLDFARRNLADLLVETQK